MGLIDKVKSIFKRFTRAPPPIPKPPVTVEEEEEIARLKQVMEELKGRKEEIQLELKKLDADFMLGKIDARKRDRQYINLMRETMKINRELANIRQRIISLGGVIEI
ncbi:MAG: hypothetical protein ACTSWP_10485 [Candidatus Freyarchaeota archaeon]|nr:hypothetical protein [Candidatus Freyrarchaeum guaymaensis]HDO81506.1 hypothetical protein [Candidatus Bathyarchaeota archaeon]